MTAYAAICDEGNLHKIAYRLAEAKSDVFNYIEMFYNPKRRHSACDNLAPVAYENAWNLRHQTV